MYGMFFGVNGFVAGRFSAAACGLHKVNAACTVTAKVKAQNAVAFFNFAKYGCACTVAKQYAGIAVFPVQNTGKGFRTDYKGFFINTAGNHLRSNAYTVNKARAACGKVKRSCVSCPQSVLHKAGGRNQA